ncbi:arginine--tRNA ligase [Catalinimonas niigatensis]|uniref:arginine--tRNA ligase n=1 Tax=Catalinimonas niigatensis TaxID=1397264 RepID=UPI002666D788|nr:arginine--tRNA ligase [Catalinimonas niigatensis]WPP53624.1 arginine--tRNA ligase [Catalinimonas niigatensis]
MDIEKVIIKDIADAFQKLYAHTLDTDEINLQPTRKEFAGSHTFVVFPYARFTKKNPQDTAQELGQYLKEQSSVVKDFNVVKGFLNLEVEDSVWVSLLHNIISIDASEKRPYGFKEAQNHKVVVEFSSPNTNKPLHLGHLRNNFLGDSLSRILKANGYQVRQVNLVNDRGIHICKSMLAYQRFGNGETPESSGIKGDHLVGKYYVRFDQAYKAEIEALKKEGVGEEQAKKEAPLIKAAQDMLQKWEQGDPEVTQLWEKMNGWVYKGFDATYQSINVSFDKIYHESETYLLGKDIVEEGLQQGVFYKKEDSSVWIDLSEDGLDEKLVLRSDGTSVYITQDMGTADLRYEDYPFDNLVYVVGNEQDYHFKVLFLILKKLGRTYADGLHHLSYGMVDLPSGKMKSREGTVVDADDLIAEMIRTAKEHTEELGKIEGFTEVQAEELYKVLGIGALKYFLLKVDPRKRMLFNPQESVQFQGNTAPFIQYTYARISAILRKAAEMQLNLEDTAVIKKQQSLHASELEVIKLLSEFSQKISLAAADYAPSVIAQYAYDLAKEYNRFYTEVSIFGEQNADLLLFRVLFSKAVAETIKSAMNLLGIQVPERM